MFEGLDLNSDIQDKLSTLGFDPGQVVTPKEFLKAIGIDPHRVVAELDLLEQNLTLDGLSPYMVRSAAMRGQAAPSSKVRPAAEPTKVKENNAVPPGLVSKPIIPVA